MILYRKPVKAQASYLTNDPMFANKLKTNQFFNDASNYWSSKQYGVEPTPMLTQVANTTFNNDFLQQSSQQVQEDALKNNGILKSPSTINAIASLGNMAVDVVGMGLQNSFDKKWSKLAENTDSFGNDIINQDEVDLAKKEKWKDAGMGTAKGALSGASVGSTILPGIGTAIGAGIGAIAGGLSGLFKGKKKQKAMEEGIDQYNENLQNNLRRYRVNQDMQLSRSLYAKNGIKTSKFNKPYKKNSVLVLRNGGVMTDVLEEPGIVNVVARGKLHKENNELGNKDKGIPIINKDGVKEYEIEAGEVVFRQEATDKINDFVVKYDSTKDDSIFDEFGKYLAEELLKNTKDYYGKFKVTPKK